MTIVLDERRAERGRDIGECDRVHVARREGDTVIVATQTFGCEMPPCCALDLVSADGRSSEQHGQVAGMCAR